MGNRVEFILLFSASLIGCLLQAFACRDGWENYQGSCYQFVVSEDRTWMAARQACQNEGAHLLSIQTKEEFDFIKGMVERGVTEVGGVLLHELVWTAGREENDGSWIWDDGTDYRVRFENINWYPNEPNNHGGNEDFMDILYMDGQWGMNDAPESFRLRSICEYDTCPAGWKAYGQSCYKFVVSNSVYRNDADQACQNEGARLVSVNSVGEFNFLKEEIKSLVLHVDGRFNFELWWTSGVRKGSSNEFAWGDDTDLFLNDPMWYPGEPNDAGGNEDYINILYKDYSWGLNDAPGYFQLRYICEKYNHVTFG